MHLLKNQWKEKYRNILISPKLLMKRKSNWKKLLLGNGKNHLGYSARFRLISKLIKYKKYKLKLLNKSKFNFNRKNKLKFKKNNKGKHKIKPRNLNQLKELYVQLRKHQLYLIKKIRRSLHKHRRKLLKIRLKKKVMDQCK